MTEKTRAAPKNRSRRWLIGVAVLIGALWLWNTQGTRDPRLVGTWTMTVENGSVGYSRQWHFHDFGPLEKSFFIGPSKPGTEGEFWWRTRGDELLVLPNRKPVGNVLGEIERLIQRALRRPTMTRYRIEKLTDTELVIVPVTTDWPANSARRSFRRESATP